MSSHESSYMLTKNRASASVARAVLAQLTANPLKTQSATSRVSLETAPTPRVPETVAESAAAMIQRSGGAMTTTSHTQSSATTLPSTPKSSLMNAPGMSILATRRTLPRMCRVSYSTRTISTPLLVGRPVAVDG